MTYDEVLVKLETRPIENNLKKDNDTIRQLVKSMYDDYYEEVMTNDLGYIPSYPEFGRYTPNTKVRIYIEEFE